MRKVSRWQGPHIGRYIHIGYFYKLSNFSLHILHHLITPFLKKRLTLVFQINWDKKYYTQFSVYKGLSQVWSASCFSLESMPTTR